jgi:glycosyltransferase involved in cell wall biosynthesis
MKSSSQNQEKLQRYKYNTSMSKITKDDFTVVVPVLNEEEGIENVIKEIKKEGYHNILVIDGYSTDNTVYIASTNKVEVILQHGIGKTGAIKTAIENINTPYFIVMDGDCTYDPKDIKNFFDHIQKYDEIIGVRTFGRENIPFMNRFGNWVINFTFNILLGTNLVDVCSGMYALKTDFANQLRLETNGFDVEVEVAAQASIEGKITQVPISYHKRVGKQKLHSLRHGLQILSTIRKLGMLYNPVFLYSALTTLTMIPALMILSWVVLDWLNGIWHGGLALFGVLLFIISLFSLTINIISTLLKRMEQRIIKKLKTSFLNYDDPIDT